MALHRLILALALIRTLLPSAAAWGAEDQVEGEEEEEDFRRRRGARRASHIPFTTHRGWDLKPDLIPRADLAQVQPLLVPITPRLRMSRSTRTS